MNLRKLAFMIGAFALALGIFSAQSSFAQKEQRLPPGLPPYGPLKLAAPPDVKVSTLANGMTVWLVRQPGVPKVAFALTIRGGMASDPANLPGLSELFSDSITQGTKSHSARQIAEEIQAAGGDLSATADKDDIGLTTSVLSEKAASGLAVLADVARNASFPDDEVDLAKRNLSDTLSGQEADPGFLARRALAKALFGEHPYSIIFPTRDSITQATSADLRAEFAQRFRPDQALLVAAGDFDLDKISANVEELFGAWKSPDTPAIASLPRPPTSAPHGVFLVPREGSVQTALYFGGFGPLRSATDYEATEVATAIYGGMFSSRLVRNIREDKGYTYSPGSRLQTYRQAGVLRTRADVRNPVTGASFNEMTYELNRMATTGVEKDELAQARLFLVGIQAIELQSRDAVANALATLWVDGLPPGELATRNEKIAKMTAEDVNAAAARYFPAAQMAVVAVGEEKVVRDQLAPFGLEIKDVK